MGGGCKKGMIRDDSEMTIAQYGSLKYGHHRNSFDQIPVQIERYNMHPVKRILYELGFSFEMAPSRIVKSMEK